MKAITAAILMALASPATADEECALRADIAEAVMRNRQAGTSLEDILKVFEGSPNGQIGRDLIGRAYWLPLYGHDEGRRWAVQDFRATVLEECSG